MSARTPTQVRAARPSWPGCHCPSQPYLHRPYDSFVVRAAGQQTQHLSISPKPAERQRERERERERRTTRRHWHKRELHCFLPFCRCPPPPSSADDWGCSRASRSAQRHRRFKLRQPRPRVLLALLLLHRPRDPSPSRIIATLQFHQQLYQRLLYCQPNTLPIHQPPIGQQRLLDPARLHALRGRLPHHLLDPDFLLVPLPLGL